MPAFRREIACTMNSEFTIRSVPSELDLALRIRAEREGKSLNAVVLEILADGLDLDGAAGEYHELDDLAGSWKEDPEFDAAIARFEKIDDADWK